MKYKIKTILTLFILLDLSSAYAVVPASVALGLSDMNTDIYYVAGLAFSAFLVLVTFVYLRMASK